jgi:sortase (surface protein transpeptidase)
MKNQSILENDDATERVTDLLASYGSTLDAATASSATVSSQGLVAARTIRPKRIAPIAAIMTIIASVAGGYAIRSATFTSAETATPAMQAKLRTHMTAKQVSSSVPLPTVRSGRSKAKPTNGDVVGRLVIDKAGIDATLVFGSTSEDLKNGPGYAKGSGEIGGPGNAVIACHRTVYGAPCFNLHLLAIGDPIFVTVAPNVQYRYEVTDVVIDEPGPATSGAIGWFSTKDPKWTSNNPKISVLTIITLTPQYTAKQRLVARARLVGREPAK